MKVKLLIIIGIAMMIEGFLIPIYSSTFLLPPTEPPTMRPIEGIDHILLVYRQAFFLSGIVGIFATSIGIVLFWRKRK